MLLAGAYAMSAEPQGRHDSEMPTSAIHNLTPPGTRRSLNDHILGLDVKMQIAGSMQMRIASAELHQYSAALSTRRTIVILRGRGCARDLQPGPQVAVTLGHEQSVPPDTQAMHHCEGTHDIGMVASVHDADLIAQSPLALRVVGRFLQLRADMLAGDLVFEDVAAPITPLPEFAPILRGTAQTPSVAAEIVDPLYAPHFRIRRRFLLRHLGCIAGRLSAAV